MTTTVYELDYTENPPCHRCEPSRYYPQICHIHRFNLTIQALIPGGKKPIRRGGNRKQRKNAAVNCWLSHTIMRAAEA